VLGSSLHHAPPTPPPDAPGKPLRKRRRTHRYVGEADTDSSLMRFPRLKRWVIGMGRKERERVKALETAASSVENCPKPRLDVNEIAADRGVQLIPEGKGMSSFLACQGCAMPHMGLDPPGTYLPVRLSSVTRAPTLQHISERVALVCAQHNLGPPTKTVAALMVTACEVLRFTSSLKAHLMA
jgi:hypothetical protein